MRTTKEIESELINDKRTLEKRKEIKEKLKVLGETDENTEFILCLFICKPTKTLTVKETYFLYRQVFLLQ